MKILIVTDAYYPQVNGVVRTLHETGEILKSQGQTIEYITPQQFLTVPMPKYNEIRLSLNVWPRVSNLINSIKPDAIHIATEGPLGFMARRHCIKNGLKFTTSFHTRFDKYMKLYMPIIPAKWSEKCPIHNTKLKDLTNKFPNLNAYILGVIRDESFKILKKDDKLQHNDKAYVIVNSNQMEETLKVFGHNEKIANKILIIGGGNIGFNLALNIENNFEEARVKIIEKNKERAEYIANYLNDTIVINGNGLEEDVLNEANLDEVETVLALTNDDEDNLMVSVLVEKFSKDKRTMALVNKPNYSLLQSSLKIDDLIDPRMSTVSSILKHVHKGTIENAYTILNGEYEVIEADILETSELLNKELKNADLPDEIRVGAILRDGKFILPSSKYVFQKDDTVVLLAKRDQLPLVENLFRISSI